MYSLHESKIVCYYRDRHVIKEELDNYNTYHWYVVIIGGLSEARDEHRLIKNKEF